MLYQDNMSLYVSRRTLLQDVAIITNLKKSFSMMKGADSCTHREHSEQKYLSGIKTVIRDYSRTCIEILIEWHVIHTKQVRGSYIDAYMQIRKI
jgi:hypothetical protein